MEVKWVKLTTDMFDNRKIKYIRRLPDGNNIVLIWVMLLTMAGRCNSGGMIFLTENIPYTPKSLADELDFEENTVRLALEALERLNMIVTDNGCFRIAGWEEYQNIDGMEKVKEQNRLRQKKWYDKQKALPNVNPNVNPNVRITQPNATDIEKDIDTDIETEKEPIMSSFNSSYNSAAVPTEDEVIAFAESEGLPMPEEFYRFCARNHWTVKGEPIYNWQAFYRGWAKFKRPPAPPAAEKPIDLSDLDKMLERI